MRKLFLATIAGLAIFCLAGLDRPIRAQQLRGYDYINASSGNVANATATATLAAAGNLTNWITGFEITNGGATAASCVTATVTGLVGGAESYTVCAPTGAGVAATPLLVQYTSPVPASGPGVAISVSLPALGSGNTNSTVNIHGYRAQ
jgi:hypothetical protein